LTRFTIPINAAETDPVAEIRRLTGGQANEAMDRLEHFGGDVCIVVTP
jgi:hypothetical protein